MEKTERKKIVGRGKVHFSDEKFNTYFNVIKFLIDNRYKAFSNLEIRKKFYDDEEEAKKTSVKAMFKSCINFYVSCGILTKIVILTNKNNEDIEIRVTSDYYDFDDKSYEVELDDEIVKVKATNGKVRLYNKEVDIYDEFGDIEYEVVDLKIPSNDDGIINLCNIIASMVIADKNANISSEKMKPILETNMFGFQTDFVVQTISKTILKQQKIKKNFNYPLDLIITIMKSKINVNITLENSGNTIELKNTKIKKISIKENGLDIHFDNFISQNHSDLNQIKLIENSSEDNLIKDIETVKELIEKLPADEKIKISEILDEVYILLMLFEF